LAAFRDFVPADEKEAPTTPAATPAPPPPEPAAPPVDTTLPRAVFPWLAARIVARRRESLPISEASLRADLALGFAAEVGEAHFWPEALYEGESGPRLHLLVRPPDGKPSVAVASQYPRRANPGQLPATGRQLGDLLRDSLRLAKSFGAGGLPVQVLLCTDEFRTYLSTLRPPLRLLRADAVGGVVAVDLPLSELGDATLTRLADAFGERHTTLHLVLEVLGYAPVGPMHLGMWRVAAASPA
jgi:hypothetical protein